MIPKQKKLSLLLLIGGITTSLICFNTVSLHNNTTSELIKLNIEALTTSEASTKKVEIRTEHNIIEEKRQHCTDGYRDYDIVTVNEFKQVICEGIGLIDCTPSITLETTNFYEEECPYKSEADCKFFRK